MLICGAKQRLTDIHEAEFDAGSLLVEQVPSQPGFENPITGTQGEHLEDRRTDGSEDLLGRLGQRNASTELDRRD